MATLPGIKSVMADGRLRIAPKLSGPKLVILGTTTNTGIDTMVPYALTDANLGVAATLHENSEASELSLAVEEALLAGSQNITVMKIAEESGELASYTANDRWDDLRTAYGELRARQVDIVHPAGTYIDDGTLTGSDPGGASRDNFGKQLADFCHRATSADGNTIVGVIGVKPIMKFTSDESVTGAPSGLGGEHFDFPSRTHLSEYVDYLSAAGSYTSSELVASTYNAGSDETSPGVLDSSYDFWARDDDETISEDQFGTKVDGGGFISVVAGVCRIPGPSVKRLGIQYGEVNNTTRNTNGASSYAGFIATLDPQVATTNKPVPGLSPARELSRSQATTILTERFVTFLTRPGVGYVTLKGITGAYNASDFTRSDYTNLSTRRIANTCVDIVSRVGTPYIGYPISDQSLGALDSDIDSGLRAFQQSGGIRSFDFEIISSPEDQVLGQVFVIMSVVPAFELDTITVHFQLAKE